jgi:hypothetical protein
MPEATAGAAVSILKSCNLWRLAEGAGLRSVKPLHPISPPADVSHYCKNGATFSRPAGGRPEGIFTCLCGNFSFTNIFVDYFLAMKISADVSPWYSYQLSD